MKRLSGVYTRSGARGEGAGSIAARRNQTHGTSRSRGVKVAPLRTTESGHMVSKLQSQWLAGRKTYALWRVAWKLLLILTLIGALPFFVDDQATVFAQNQTIRGNAMIATPKTLLELLARIDSVTSDDRMLKEEFFTDEGVKRIFGANHIEWFSKSARSGFAAKISAFYSMRDKVNLSDKVLIYLGRKMEESGNFSAYLTLHILYNDGITYSEVERTFGRSWLPSPQHPPSFHGALPPATNPHGNDSIEYLQRDNAVERSIKVVFYPNATLQVARFTIMGKGK